jgi:5'-nucleotidase
MHMIWSRRFIYGKEIFMKRKSSLCIALHLVFSIFLVAGAQLFGQAPFKILISNDDGINAPGIAALFEKLSIIGTVTVAAPAQNSSGASHSMTFSEPILVMESEKNGSKWFSIKATPATCVRLALESLVSEKPDLIVTGINKGENLGTVTYYSGTVGCAREAAVKGIPAIAVSLANGPTMDYGPAAEFVADLVRKLKENSLKPGVFLVVNVPNLPQDQIKGLMVVPQDTRPSYEFYERRVNPSGQVYFWNTYKELEPGQDKTDVWALRNGYISIVPFQIDQTSFDELKSLESIKIGNWNK